MSDNINFLSWNVRGLNDPDRQATVHEIIASSSCHLVCLQETKLCNVDQFTAAFLGGYRLKSFAQRPALGTRGGILLLWDDAALHVTNIVATEFCLSASVQSRLTGIAFKVTSVYGPTSYARKDDFFNELIAQKPASDEKWLAMGDFNQIYRARQKNKRNVNRSRLNRFRAALTTCELKEIHLQNRRFTWSNERNNPTMCKLDGFFCNDAWGLHFDSHILNALSSALSDHCPLLLADDSGPRRPKTFKFENFWTGIPGFHDVVARAWTLPSGHDEPYQNLFHKLKNVSKGLSKWSRGLFSNSKVILHAALLVILHLDIAQESRTLSFDEQDLRASLKRRVISLAILERARKKQSSRIANIKEGDANTKFFHLRVNARRRKNHIHRIKHNGGWVTDHSRKEEILHSHFSSSMGVGQTRKRDLNWESLNFGNVALEGIDEPFTEEEVFKAISQMPTDKAPGPDGFTGAFFKRCWGTIK
jgi:exonuclease III